jgi:hypothetical protein
MIAHNCVMFSLAYGKTAEGFAAMWKMPLEETKKLIEGFRSRFKVLAAWLDDQGATAEIQQYSALVNGAMRVVGGEGDSAGARNGRKRAGANYQIQGLSSWAARRAIYELDKTALERSRKISLVAFVHDELLVEIEAHDDCPYAGFFWGKDAQSEDLKSQLQQAESAKDKELAKKVGAELKARKAELRASCDHVCVDKECAWENETIIGDAMRTGGEYVLEGVLKAGYEIKLGSHWEH